MLKNKAFIALACIAVLALAVTGCIPNQRETAPAPEQPIETPVAPEYEDEVIEEDHEDLEGYEDYDEEIEE